MEMPERESEMRVAKRRTPVVLAVVCAVLALIVLGPIAASRARAHAEEIQCANILSSLELSTRTYALDYHVVARPHRCDGGRHSPQESRLCRDLLNHQPETTGVARRRSVVGL